MITNTTSICNELIKAISLDVGLDLSSCNLEVNYLTSINGKVLDGCLGKCDANTIDGKLTIIVSVIPSARTETLAHELRHGYQIQTWGVSAFSELYLIESKYEGYDNNIFEVDARDAGNRWVV